MNKEKMLSGLLKAGIIAAGTGIGMMISKCFSVEETVEEGDEEPEIIEGEVIEIKETKEEVKG